MKLSRTALLAAAILGAGLALTLTGQALARSASGNRSVPEPAKAVDLDKYLGQWFEIARYEQSFERGCRSVTATYTRRADGGITVLNRCRKPSGAFKEATGRAKLDDAKTNAKLKVSFFGPFYAPYWVLDHADDYSWSIVGEPSGRYLWILAREPTPSDAEVASLYTRARALGYDTSRLLRTPQP
jgi:apolipoprotein D and lipocalin family protein